MDMMDIRTAHTTTREDLVEFGCIPGGYICQCVICTKYHISAKRAIRCESCAIKRKEFHEEEIRQYWEDFRLNHRGTD